VPEAASHLALLRQAVLEDRELGLTYRRRDGTRFVEDVKPYGLVAKAENWYLVAETRRGMRVLRVTRIEAARRRPRVFERREDFDLERFWKRWAGQFEASRTGYPVKLRIEEEDEERAADALGPQARAALRSARLSRGAKRISVDFEKEAYAVSSVAGLGPGVRVLEPASLRARLHVLGASLCRVYAQRAQRAE
jgi:predicted DNA-binding transcriptional regulator YafY